MPLSKEVADLHRALPARIAQQAVNFGNHLHIGIFDAIMNRLHKMPRPVGAKVRHAGGPVKTRGNRLSHGLELLPRMRAATDHHRWAVTSARFTARHAHADKMQPRAFKLNTAAAGVVEIGVAAVNQRVALAQQWPDRLNHRIHRRARGDHKQNCAGLRDGGDKFLKALGSGQSLGQGASLG